MGVSCGRDTWDRVSDRCSRFFPCFSDPARRSALTLKAALVVLHLVFAGVLFLFDNDLIVKTKHEPWYTVVYVLLFVATLIQYFVTSGTAPGYVIDAQRAVDERDAAARRTSFASKQTASSKNDSVSIIMDGRNYHRGNATAWTKLVMDLYPPGTSTRNLTCPYCHVIQPPRAKHCHDCDKCILQFDHHCVWLGTCIGQGNHCRFWYPTSASNSFWLNNLFLVAVEQLGDSLEEIRASGGNMLGPAYGVKSIRSTRWYICEETALCLWTSILYIGYLKSNILKAWWADIIMILLLATLSISIVFLLLLLLFHSYLIMTNQTTYELVRRRRIIYMRGIPERVYPFHKGVCRNLYLFCFGRSSIYRMEALPTAEELEVKSRPYTCCDVLSCRCC